MNDECPAPIPNPVPCQEKTEKYRRLTASRRRYAMIGAKCKVQISTAKKNGPPLKSATTNVRKDHIEESTGSGQRPGRGSSTKQSVGSGPVGNRAAPLHPTSPGGEETRAHGRAEIPSPQRPVGRVKRATIQLVLVRFTHRTKDSQPPGETAHHAFHAHHACQANRCHFLSFPPIFSYYKKFPVISSHFLSFAPNSQQNQAPH